MVVYTTEAVVNVWIVDKLDPLLLLVVWSSLFAIISCRLGVWDLTQFHIILRWF